MKRAKTNESNIYDIKKQIDALENIFDSVMLVEPISKDVYVVDSTGIKTTKRKCWDKCKIAKDRCGCICNLAIANKGESVSRLAVGEDESHFVIAKKVKLYSKELVLIMSQQVGSKFTFGTTSSDKDFESIYNMNNYLYIDTLTSLYNRRYWEDKSAYLLNEARYSDKEMCIASIDIDNFKGFNDTYGHDIGDKVLRILADKMMSVTDNMCSTHPIRIGGDEFLILSESEYSSKEFRNYMNILVDKVKSSKIKINKGYIHITISIGVASTKDKTVETVEELYKKADIALYKAKEAGKNCVR